MYKALFLPCHTIPHEVKTSEGIYRNREKTNGLSVKMDVFLLHSYFCLCFVIYNATCGTGAVSFLDINTVWIGLGRENR